MSDEEVEFEEPTPGPTSEEAAAEEAQREDVQVQREAGEFWEAKQDETRGDDSVLGGDDILVGLVPADTTEEE